MKKLALLLVLLVPWVVLGLSALGDTAQAQSGARTTLVLIDGEGDLTVLGLIRTESACEVIASRLNFYARLPPADSDRFYCRLTF